MVKIEKGIIPKVIASLIAVLSISLIVYGASHPAPNAHIGNGKAWNNNMVLGDNNAPNIMIDYTDYFCPYCAEVHDATSDSRFIKKYIDTGKVKLENRIVTVLSGVSVNTERGAEAAYCSADQGKYWKYSDDIISRIETDYFDKGIGRKDVANPQKIEKLPVSYFVTSAENAGLDTNIFESCVTNEKHKTEIANNTQKAINLGLSGLPYLVVNNYVTSGFSGGYDGLVTVLKAGGAQ